MTIDCIDNNEVTFTALKTIFGLIIKYRISVLFCSAEQGILRDKPCGSHLSHLHKREYFNINYT